MPFVPAPQIVKVEVRATFDAQHVENSFEFDALETVTQPIVDEVTNLVSVWAQAHYFPLLPTVISLNEVVGTDMSDENGFTHTITPAGSVTGGRGGAPMPNETTFCVSMRSGSRGRSARGRKYVLGILKDDTSGNSLIGPMPGNFVTAFQELIDTMATEGRPYVIVSRISNGAPRSGGPVYFPVVTAVAVDNTLDSQRKRKPGNGS
jgi:hypothetical protein